jgi:hypothetical protein
VVILPDLTVFEKNLIIENKENKTAFQKSCFIFSPNYVSGSHDANSVVCLVLRFEPLGRLFVVVHVVFVRLLLPVRLDRELVVLDDSDLVLIRTPIGLPPVVPVDVHREGTDRGEHLGVRMTGHPPLVRDFETETAGDITIAVHNELLVIGRNEPEEYGVATTLHLAQPSTEQSIVTLGEAAVIELDPDGILPLDLARHEVSVVNVELVYCLAEVGTELGVAEVEAKLDPRAVLSAQVYLASFEREGDTRQDHHGDHPIPLSSLPWRTLLFGNGIENRALLATVPQAVFHRAQARSDVLHMIAELAPPLDAEVMVDEPDQTVECFSGSAPHHHHGVGEREDITPHLDAWFAFHLRLLKAFVEFSKLGENP